MEEDQTEGLSRPAFPVFLNLTGRVVAVVGGGKVGIRKAVAAVAAGAIVRLVDPLATLALPETVSRSPNFVHLPESYRPEHLDGTCLAFACATPEVNARVVADARLRAVWVNSATDPTAGDFTLPSVVRSGDLTLAVSTGGAAPALARRVRERLETEFDRPFAEWVQILAEVRRVAMPEIADPIRRRELLDSFAGWPWLARLRVEGSAEVRAAMLALVKAGHSG